MNNMETVVEVNRLDRAGALASFTCAAHCAAMPLLTGFMPVLGLGFLLNEKIELLLIVLSIGIATSSLLPSYLRKHRQWRPMILFSFGTGLMLAVQVLALHEEQLEIPAMVLGALMLAGAHVINWRLCRQCGHCPGKEARESTTQYRNPRAAA